MEPANPDMQEIKEGNIHDYDDYLDFFNCKPVYQDYKSAYHSITFVSAGIIPYSGGIVTMLRLGTLLSKQGYDVYYQSSVPQSVEDMRTDAEFNFPGYRGTCIPLESFSQHSSDIWIATLWETTYLIKNRRGYKMYLVQDYEPYFYPFGDRSELAKRTYQFGLHMISLGPWCAKMIRQNCHVNSQLDEINFPVDVESYHIKSRDFSEYPKKKELNLAVYTRFATPRRAPISVQMVLKNTERLLARKDIKLNINYYGTSQNEEFINGHNLGRLNKRGLEKLYHESDFGIAPSMTNLSLVPFEMMSSGLPYIDFNEGSGSDFMPANYCWRINFDEYELANILLQASEQPEELEEKTVQAKEYLEKMTWKKTFSDFYTIIKHINNKESLEN